MDACSCGTAVSSVDGVVLEAHGVTDKLECARSLLHGIVW